MKKRWFVLLTYCFLFIALLLSGCKTHTHTFSDKWVSNHDGHWHAATCEHQNEIKDYGVHEYNDWVIIKKATEEEEGLKEHSCKVCGYVEQEKLDKLIHQHHYEVDKVIEPTCEEDGYTHYVCSCGDSYNGDVVKTKGHQYSKWEVVQEPTLDQQGLLKRTCQKDDTHIDIKTLPILDSKEYQFKTIESPSCEMRGMDLYSYQLDSEVFEFKVVVKPLGHDLSPDWTIDQAPTCEEAGYKSHHCSRCDMKADLEEIEPLGHQYGDFKVLENPTFEQVGLLGRVCEHDNSHVVSVVLPTLNLDDYDYQSIRKPDCETTGLDLYQYTYQEVIYSIYYELEALGHQYSDWILEEAPSIDQKGTLKRICNRDSKHIEEYSLPTLNQTDYDILPSVEATCTTDGYGIYRFHIGQQTFDFEEVIVALGHDYDTWQLVTKPTLDTEGLLKRSCRRDEAHVDQYVLPPLNEQDYDYFLLSEGNCITHQKERYRFIIDHVTFDFDIERPATGHEYGAWELVLEPTLLASGSLKRTCQLDSTHQELHSLPKLNRLDYAYKQLIPSSCTEMGRSSYTYQLDSLTFVFYTDLAVLGHNYASNFSIDIEPTCDSEGLKSRHCSRCDSTIEQTRIDALGHEYGAWELVTEPTLLASGLLKRSCLHDSTHQEEHILPELNEQDYKRASITKPTCLSSGLDRYTYTYNTQQFDFEVALEALGHQYGLWQVQTTPTKEEEGEIVSICSHDQSHQLNHSLPCLNEEDYRYQVNQDPTCLVSGIAQYTYTIDQQSLNFEISLLALGHSYDEQGICVRCMKYQIFTTVPLDEDTCLLESYDGDLTVSSLEIPTVLEGRRVVKLNAHLLAGLDHLESVTLPILDQTLPSLFSNQIPESLSQVVLSSGKKIMAEAFAGTALKIIILPDSITHIEEKAFLNCTQLGELKLPKELQYIGAEAFSGCSALKSIQMNSKLSVIEANAFSSCLLLEEMTLPQSILTLGDSIWTGTSLKQMYYDGTIEAWCAITFTSPYQNPMSIVEHFYWKNGADYVEYTQLDLPSTISHIGPYQFAGLTSIESVVLSEGLFMIEKNAFENCINLSHVTLPNSIQIIKQNAFKNCDSLQYYEENDCHYLGNDSNHRLVLMEVLNKSIQRFQIDENTTIIYDFAFSECNQLRSVDMGEMVTSIGSRAFNQCSMLDNIDITDSVVYVGDQVFINMNNDFTIYCHSSNKPPLWEDTWNNLGYRVLWGIKQNEIMEIDGLLYLLNKTVAAVVGKRIVSSSIIIPESVEVEGNRYTVTGIGSGAFMGDTVLEEVILPQSIATIEDSAFKGCTQLHIIELPNEVSFIGDSAFSGCRSLEEIVIPGRVQVLSGHVFSGCSNLRRVELLSLSVIEDFAFYNCASLEELLLPASVQYIAEHAFHNCTALTIYSCAQFKPDSFPTNWFGSARAVYWYSESQPAESGAYWHYDSITGKPVIW